MNKSPFKAATPNTCEIDGCMLPVRMKSKFLGLHHVCQKHENRWRNNKTFEKKCRKNTCKVEACNSYVVSNSLCSLHYQRWVKYKSTNLPCDEMPPDMVKFCHTHGPLKDTQVDYYNSKQTGLLTPRCAQCRREQGTKGKHISKLRKHGMTPQDYEVLLEQQQNKCCICKNYEIATHRITKKIIRLAVDHCHETNKVRGLLCTKCNTALGLFNDNVKSLQAAILYLENHQND